MVESKTRVAINRLKEQIRHETAVLQKLLVLAALVGGSTLGLFLLGGEIPWPLRQAGLLVCVAGAGGLGTVGLLLLAWRADQRIHKLKKFCIAIAIN